MNNKKQNIEEDYLPGIFHFIPPLRRRAIVLLILVALVGVVLKSYGGAGRWWMNNWGASFAYEVFFMSLALSVFNTPSRTGLIALSVCAATCGLEFLQLWKPAWLEAVRSTFLGRSILGNSFSWWDLPAYPIGCTLGYFLLKRLVISPVTMAGSNSSMRRKQ